MVPRAGCSHKQDIAHGLWLDAAIKCIIAASTRENVLGYRAMRKILDRSVTRSAFEAS